MREKVYKILSRIYGIMMSISFFGGFLPLIPFVFAVIVGGELGESISLFLYKQYYPWVITIGSLALVVGLIAMYVSKQNALSIKESKTKDNEK